MQPIAFFNQLNSFHDIDNRLLFTTEIALDLVTPLNICISNNHDTDGGG
ncbi:hypothetical protein N9F50_00195 [Akkermansiaceae bacterium]|nr:hypothetical protein [Akkermansiaceae bacterium]